VEVLVGGAPSHAERGHGLPPVDGLAGVVDDALLHQLDDAVADELRVDAQVLLAAEVRENGVGDRSVAHLDGVAVLDEAGHVVSDPLGDFRVGRGVVLQQRLVVGDQEIDVVDVEEGVAVDPRHVTVDLCDDHPGRLGGGLDDVHADPHAEIAVVVGQRGLQERHVHVLEAPAEEAGHLGKVHRRVVRQPLVDGPAGAVADEEGVVPEVGLELLVGVGGHAEGPDVQDLGVEEGLGVLLDVADHGMDEMLGLGAGRGDEDRVAPVDVAENLFFRRKFSGIALSPEVQGLGVFTHDGISLSGRCDVTIKVNGGGKAVKNGNRESFCGPLFCLDSWRGKMYKASVLWAPRVHARGGERGHSF